MEKVLMRSFIQKTFKALKKRYKDKEEMFVDLKGYNQSKGPNLLNVYVCNSDNIPTLSSSLLIKI